MGITKTFQALSDPTRRKILELLKHKDMNAGEIGDNFDITLPSLSHHLGILKQAGLVTSRRQGQTMVYSLNVSVAEEAVELIIKILK